MSNKSANQPAIRLRGYAPRTEERFVRFHHLRHPATMGVPEIEAFLLHLATLDQISASTQNQALSALLFLSDCVAGLGRRRDEVRCGAPALPLC